MKLEVVNLNTKGKKQYLSFIHILEVVSSQAN